MPKNVTMIQQNTKELALEALGIQVRLVTEQINEITNTPGITAQEAVEKARDKIRLQLKLMRAVNDLENVETL